MSMALDEFGLASDVLVWQAVLLTAISVAVGVLGGFVGLALGTIRLPALLLLGMPSTTAAGTNILVSTLSALTGAVRHLREGRVEMRIVLVMGVPAVVGAFVGGFNSDRVSESVLIGAAGILVFWQGVEFLVRWRGQGRSAAARSPNSEELPAVERGVFTRNRVLAEGGIGLAIGLIGGAVGLILGSIRLPALIRVLRVDPRIAAGTNLFIGFVMGSAGWIGHVARGQVDYPMIVAMGIGAMVGSSYGATLTGRVSLDRLMLTMGGVLLLVGALLMGEAFRR